MKLRTVKMDEYTLKSGHIDVGNGHKVWFEQWGNPEAKVPVLIFNGGPGGEFNQNINITLTRRNTKLSALTSGGAATACHTVKSRTTPRTILFLTP